MNATLTRVGFSIATLYSRALWHVISRLNRGCTPSTHFFSSKYEASLRNYGYIVDDDIFIDKM